jgi:histidine triad (HIT) family protein
MTTPTTCVFCRIVRGELPCHMLVESDAAFAFMDINPANPGHALVVPKAHAANICEIEEADLTAATLLAQRVARAVNAALEPYGINIVQANGPGAAQSVQHFHWHVLPREDGDNLLLNWGLSGGEHAAIAAVAARIRSRLAP